MHQILLRFQISTLIILICIATPLSAYHHIHKILEQNDMVQLRAELAKNSKAWDSGEDYLGDTAVGLAIELANLPALKLFVENGYDLNPVEWFDHPVRLITPYTGKDTPEHMQMLKWILSAIEFHDERDYAIHLSDFVKNDHLEGAKILLDAGVNPNMWVHQNNSALDLAESDEMKELLKSYGARSNFLIFISIAIFVLLALILLVRYLLRPKQTVGKKSVALVPERNRKKGYIYRALGGVLFIGSIIGMLLVKYGSVLGVSRPDAPLFLYLAFFVIAAVGIRFIIMGEKLQTRDADEILEKAERPIFLYLRSFALDEEDAKQEIMLPGGLTVPINPWESGLSFAFSKVGDMVGIGRPGEKLATTGAARVYVTDDEWQDKVLEMVGKSDLVIWTYGSTEGLKWEISRLVKIVPPEKLVLAFPFWDQKMSKRKEIWKQAVQNLSATFPKALPDAVDKSLFIAFNKDWTSNWVKTEPPPWSVRILFLGFWNPVVNGVKNLLTKRGYVYPPLGFKAIMGYGFMALMAWGLLAGVSMMIIAFIMKMT